MSSVTGNEQALDKVKQSYKNMLALGEGANGADFRMTFEGYDDLEFLVQSTQLAAMAREMIESKGPHGVSFNQQGNFKNAVDVTFTVKEVVTGKAREALVSMVRNKEYVTITLAMISESQPTSNQFTTVVYEDSWIELDGTDLSVDDGAVLVKPTGTIHANWVNWLDDETDTLSWE